MNIGYLANAKNSQLSSHDRKHSLNQPAQRLQLKVAPDNGGQVLASHLINSRQPTPAFYIKVTF